jgi:hypothetical protein
LSTETREDTEHLRLLSIFHYVVAGLQALFACFPVFHLLVGAAMVTVGLSGEAEDAGPLAAVGAFFVAFAGAWMLVGFGLAVGTVVAGRNLARRRRYTFCLVMAGVVAAACVPFGTLLGVFTIVVLLRPSVKQAFGAA